MRYFLAVFIFFTFACSKASQPLEHHVSPQQKTSASSNKEVGQVSPKFNFLTIEKNQSKGRVQDNGIKLVDEIIVGGKESIPILIDKLTDERRTTEIFENYWSYTTVGDIAFIILTDLFTDSTWTKSTLPGTGWDEILGKARPGMTGEQQLRTFIAKHGRSAIKAKWQRIWNENRDKLYWDEQDRCFKRSP